MSVIIIEPKGWSPRWTHTRPAPVQWMDDGYVPCAQCGEQGRIWANGVHGPGFYPCGRCGGIGRQLQGIALLDR